MNKFPTMTAASLLGLRPLDRVQVNDRRAISEMRTGSRMGMKSDLDWLYFQKINEEGRLVLRSPGGYKMAIDADDICDVRRGEEVRVMAMPQIEFLKRLSLPLAQRQNPPADSCYRPGSLMYVSKDRWNRLDQTFVVFDDPQYNGTDSFSAPLNSESRDRVSALAKRSNMPVVSLSTSTASADQGIEAEERLAHAIVSGFLCASIAGATQVAEQLASEGLYPIKRPALNRLLSRLV